MLVGYQITDQVGIITANYPPVNALSPPLRKELLETLHEAGKDESKAIVITCAGRTFMAGADITEFGKPPASPTLHDVLTAVEQSQKPIIAALHGTALGGGLELALACHYRCALSTTKIGLPEIKLGLIPGAGGTQRTPRLAGAEAALELILNGEPIGAGKAAAMHLIDKIIEGDDLLDGAVYFAREIISTNAPLKLVRNIKIDPASVPPQLFDNYRRKLEKNARGQIAPQHALTCIEAAVNLPVEEGLKKEYELFNECMYSPQSKAMRHLFFAEREAAKIKDLPKDTPVREINTVGIVGAGTMGGGIAMCFANAGIPVKMLEVNNEALNRGLNTVDRNYASMVKRNRLTREESDQRRALITGTTDYYDFKAADLVIEAVFEDMTIKKEVFKKLDAQCKPRAILATNTSYQDINEIAAVTQRPEDVVGLHFFSPANIMKLLEVIRAGKTADDVIATAMKLAKTINKVPVLAKVCYGFIGNRMFRVYGQEVQHCLIGGATPEQIDTAMENWGMAMGPLAVWDLAGLDIGYKARQALTPEQKGNPLTFRIPDTLAEMGRLGQKTGAGYYKYDPETRARLPDPEVIRIIEEQAAALGVQRCPVPEREIQERLVYALVNEGARILEEGIAQRSGDIDIVYRYGYGFPAFRGGPMYHAGTVGLKQVCAAIRRFEEKYGSEFWQPAPLLKKLAGQNKTFDEYASDANE